MAGIRSCSHIKDDGSPCEAIPVHNSPYCYFHRKYYQPEALPGEPKYIAPLLESHEAILLAVTQLYQAFLSRKLDMKEANFSLQILRLASKTVTAIAKVTKDKEGLGTPADLDRPEPKKTIAVTTPNPAPTADSKYYQALKQDLDRKPPKGESIYDPYGCLAHLKK